ncbi:hypothetical protein Lal_00014143 [Lupinus albus]|nr:hypothetical protein Lal_00014143 [Lupinus albus]
MGIDIDARCNTGIGRDAVCGMSIDLDARVWHEHWLALTQGWLLVKFCVEVPYIERLPSNRWIGGVFHLIAPFSAPGDIDIIGRTSLPNSLFLLFYLFYALYLIVCDQRYATIASAAPTILYGAYVEFHEELKKLAKINADRKRLILVYEKQILEMRKFIDEL